MSEKLTDQIKYDVIAAEYVNTILHRISAKILEKAKDQAYKSNQVRISKAMILASLHELGIHRFSDPED